jgi:hypothetical protein
MHSLLVVSIASLNIIIKLVEDLQVAIFFMMSAPLMNRVPYDFLKALKNRAPHPL